MRKFVFSAIAAAFVAAAVPAKAANIVQTAAAAGQFNTLLAAAQAAGLVGALSGHNHLTVFAPTDAAFAKLPKGTVENLLKPENRDQLVAVLSYHVVPGAVRAADIPHGVTQVGTIKQGGDTKVTTTRFGKRVTVDFSRVVQADIHASNGVIHVIDRVLLPTR